MATLGTQRCVICINIYNPTGTVKIANGVHCVLFVPLAVWPSSCLGAVHVSCAGWTSATSALGLHGGQCM